MPELIGTGRINETGGAGTMTIPKDVREKFGAEKGNGVDVAFFMENGTLIVKKASEVEL
ncbi:MAG: AbrB/MazE/SpoVT family DNA-binding domain-containing protein [Halobacteriaceae archaeon]